LILEDSVDTREAERQGIEEGLEVLRRLHEIRGSRATASDPEQADAEHVRALPEAQETVPTNECGSAER
jgi:hypothetical protein